MRNNPDTMTIEAADESLYLADRMKALGYTVAELARELGTSRNIIHELLRGSKPLTRKMAKRLNEMDPDCRLVPTWRIERKPSTEREPEPFYEKRKGAF
jgi:transcriptional regulator with XRE-family HTH domain